MKFLLLLLSMPVHAAAPLKLFDKSPSSLTLTELAGGTEQKIALAANKVIVLEAWSTYCGPCVNAHAELLRLRSLYPELEILAYSKEELPMLMRYASQRLRAESQTYFRSKDYIFPVPSLPSAVVIYKGVFVWQGNPVFPKGGLAKVLEKIMAGRFDLAKEKAAAGQTLKLSEKLKASTLKVDVQAQKLLALLDAEIASARAAMPQKPGYMDYWHLHRAMIKKLRVQRDLLWNRAMSLAANKLEKELLNSYRRASDLLAGMKDDLAFLARDIYQSGLKLPELYLLADELALQAFELKEESQYPGSVAATYAERLRRKGKLNSALDQLRRARKNMEEKEAPKEEIDEIDAEINSLEALVS